MNPETEGRLEMTSELPQGQALSAISSPDSGAGQFMLIAGQHDVESIEVSQLAGPMGWYDGPQGICDDMDATNAASVGAASLKLKNLGRFPWNGRYAPTN